MDILEEIKSMNPTKRGIYIKNHFDILKQNFDDRISESSQLHYHIVNGITEIPKCICNKNKTFSLKHRTYFFCSKECKNKAASESRIGIERPDTITQKIQESISKNNDLSDIGIKANLNRLLKMYPNLLEDTKFLDHRNPSITERKHYVENNLVEIQKCKNCGDKEAKFDKKHSKFICCSKECSDKICGIVKPKPQDKKVLDYSKFLDEHYDHDYRQKQWHFENQLDQIVICEICNENPGIFGRLEVRENGKRISQKYGYRPCSKGCSKIQISIKSNESMNCISFVENELGDFVQSLGFDIERSNRKLLKGQEIDIVVPSKRLAIEFNGLYWHSDIKKIPKYHYNKTESANRIGYDLIQIWEDDWKNKKEIVKNIIRNRLGITSNKIYARKCDMVKITDLKIINRFLSENHIIGTIPNLSICYGLEHSGEIISLMTFSKISDTEYNLSRFCSKLDTNVIGGASRLYNQFKKEFPIQKIISFANLDYFNGGLYDKLGMGFIGKTRPSYWYFKTISEGRLHKFNFRKDRLKKKYPYIDINKTESEITSELGFKKIYDCGLKRFVDDRQIS